MSSTEINPDWVDDVAVQRAVRGEGVGRPLSSAEKAATARRMRAAGAGHSLISIRLGLSFTKVAEVLGEEPEPRA